MFRVVIASSVLIGLVFLGNVASAQSEQRFRYIHFNPTMEPEGLQDIARECLGDKICQVVLKKASTAIGVPNPEIVLPLLNVAINSGSKKGEETKLTVSPEAGFRFCYGHIEMHSAAPKDEGKRSSLSVSVHSDAIGFYAHTPKQDIGKGRSWIDLVLTVSQVPADEYPELWASQACTIGPKAAGSNPWHAQYHCNSDSGSSRCGNRYFNIVQ